MNGGKGNMKKTIWILIASMLLMTGCGPSVNSVSVTESDAPERQDLERGSENVTENSDHMEEEAEAAVPIFGLGETAEAPDAYSLTILAANETEERNQFSDEEVAQVIVIDYMYENLGLDQAVQISDLDFKFVDEGGNMCDTYPVSGIHDGSPATMGARSFSSMTIGTVEESSQIRVLYYENIFDSKPACEFTLPLNETVSVDYADHQAPHYESMYEIGEIIEVSTDEGDYTICIDGVTVTDDRNQFEVFEPAVVYQVDYTYSNISCSDGLYISDIDFEAIDGKGNMMESYPGDLAKYPQDTVQGARCSAQMAFGAYAEGDQIILSYSDNLFSDQPDLFVKVQLNGGEADGPESQLSEGDAEKNRIDLSTDDGSLASEEKQNQPAVAVDKNLLTVEYTLSPSFMDTIGGIDPEETMAADPGFKKIVVNEDGSVTFTVTRDRYNQMIDELQAEMEATVEELVGGPDTLYVNRIDFDEDFRLFEVYVDRAQYENAFDMTPWMLGITAMMSQQFMGVETRVDVNVIDESSSEVIGAYHYPEDL
jgi:hypothetical protein